MFTLITTAQNRMALHSQHALFIANLKPTNHPLLKYEQPTLINTQLSVNPLLSGRSHSRPLGLHWNNPRQSPSFISASSGESSPISHNSSSDAERSSHRQLLHHFSLRMILEVITFIWRLPGFIAGFLKKEEKLLETIEDDINEAIDVIKVGSKVVEGLAEGIEKVAEAIDDKDLEKMAKTVEEDAKRVDIIMDKVKEKTKVAHDELEEVASSLGETMQGMEKVAAKVQAKAEKVSNEEDSKDLKTVATSPTTTASHIVSACNKEHHSAPLEKLVRFWQVRCLLSHFYFHSSSFLPFLAHFGSLLPSFCPTIPTRIKAFLMVSTITISLLAPFTPMLLF